MILFSSRESIRNQEVSALSIVETLLAISFSIWIFYHFGYTDHIALSAAVAPFLLMRTPRSTEVTLTSGYIACRFVHRLIVRIGPEHKKHKPVVYIFLVLGWFLLSTVLGVLAAIATKFMVSLFCVLRHPIEALGYIPENWRKLVLCTDSATFPEIIPGIDDLSDEDPRQGIQTQFSLVVWKKEMASKGLPTRFLTGLVFLPGWIPGLVYRWALKSTALIWSPFVWAFSPIRKNDDPTIFARGILNLSIFRFARLYSAFVIGLFIAKMFVLLFWLRLSGAIQYIVNWPVISAYLVPESLPIWHVTALINALLTWIIFFSAERYLYNVVNRIPVSPTGVMVFFKTSFVIRNILSIYTAVCALYITIELTRTLNIPALHFIFFPW